MAIRSARQHLTFTHGSASSETGGSEIITVKVAEHNMGIRLLLGGET
jgi:hypothetical protein